MGKAMTAVIVTCGLLGLFFFFYILLRFWLIALGASVDADEN